MTKSGANKLQYRYGCQECFGVGGGGTRLDTQLPKSRAGGQGFIEVFLSFGQGAVILKIKN